MAVLEKIRVKMGAFITVLIAVALLSFIIDPDTLQSTMSMFSSKYDVGEINGSGVSYQNFQKKVDYYTQVYQLTQGNASSDEKSQEMINNSAWQDEIMQGVIIPAAKNAGVTLGEVELLDLSQGSNISPVLLNDPSFVNENGAFDRNRFVQFIQAIPQDESGNLALYWDFLENNIYNDQIFSKYLSLLEKSNVMSPVELTKAIANNNTTYDVNFVMQPFGFALDTTISVSSQEIKAYYDNNKQVFKQPESKDLEYVVFEVVPSAEDINYAENDINKIYPEFEQTSNIKAFLAKNSDQPYNPYYFSNSELKRFSPVLEDFAVNAKVGESLKPFKEDNSFASARVLDIKFMPDSVFVKHILLQGDDEAKADSLLAVIKKGGNFSAIAQNYSADKNPNVAEPGDIGWMTQQYMIPGMENVLNLKAGDVEIVKTQYGTHIVKVNQITKPSKKYQLALLVKEAVASKQTYSDFYAKANDIVSKSEGNITKFNQVSKEADVPVYPAMRVSPSAKGLANYDKAKEVIRWANENKTGAVSPIITVDNKYFFVVGITAEHPEGYASLSEVSSQIKNVLMMEKKGKKLAEEAKLKVAGAQDINLIAEQLGTTVSSQNGIAFSSLTSQQLDPKFVGAIAAGKEGVINGPVVGDIGVYYFVINGKEVGAFYTEDDAKNRKNQEFSYVSRIIPMILSEKAEVKDQRYKFY